MKSMRPRGTSATMDAVPRMNMAQITGEETMTDCPMERAGSRLSPARMAMYSSPHSAPKSIWPNSARLRMLTCGAATEKGV